MPNIKVEKVVLPDANLEQAIEDRCENAFNVGYRLKASLMFPDKIVLIFEK